MTFALQMLARTPAYVWVLLAYLIWHGARSMVASTQAVWRLLLTPAIFAVTSLALLAGRPDVGVTTLAAWGAGMLALLPLGIATGPRLIAVDRRTGLVTRASSVVPLVRNLLIFALQYGMAVAAAVQAPNPASLALAIYAVSGASIGYFAGWTITLRRRYFNT